MNLDGPSFLQIGSVYAILVIEQCIWIYTSSECHFMCPLSWTEFTFLMKKFLSCASWPKHT